MKRMLVAAALPNLSGLYNRQQKGSAGSSEQHHGRVQSKSITHCYGWRSGSDCSRAESNNAHQLQQLGTQLAECS